MAPIRIRVATRWLESSRTLTAKAKYIKAVDFTIGLLRRLQNSGTGELSDVPVRELTLRLIELRGAAQSGVNLQALSENIGILNTYGKRVLDRVEILEMGVLPSDRDYAAFVKPFPKNVDNAITTQARYLEGVIARELDVPREAVSGKVLNDKAFFNHAFAVCGVEISGMYRKIVSKMSLVGDLEHRMKAAKSCWGKQHREGGLPFYMFKDLVGTRISADSLKEVCEVAAQAQKSFGILDKKNYYLKGEGYNAINYNMNEGWFVFEFQLKSKMNATEAALSHDLIYAPEKAVINLSEEQRRLVEMVISVSTQLSMKQWNQYFGVPVKLARRAR